MILDTFVSQKKAHGNYLSQGIDGHFLIQSHINSIPIKAVLSINSFFTYINRDEAIRLELKSHPSLIVSHDFSKSYGSDKGMLAYICLANVNILGNEQQVLVKVSSEEKLCIFGNDLRKVFDLHIHRKCFTVKDNPPLFKKDYQIFERLLQQNNISKLDLIPIKDLDYI